MKHLILALTAAFLTAAHAAPVSLFDGKTLDGWEALPARLSAAQLVQAKATWSSDFGPKPSEERATMRPPKAR